MPPFVLPGVLKLGGGLRVPWGALSRWRTLESVALVHVRISQALPDSDAVDPWGPLTLGPYPMSHLSTGSDVFVP